MSKTENLIDITTDGHVHTRLCHHAIGEMEDYVRAGISCGLGRIVFLEHFECGIDYFECTWLNPDDFCYYQQEGERLREKYRGIIKIGLGVEVGFNPQKIPETLAFLKSYKWDRVGLSYHFLATEKGHVNLVSRKKINIKAAAAYGHEKIISSYFSGLLEALEQIPATVLCHLDAVLRHSSNVLFTPQHQQMINEILTLLKEKNIALEINTSGFAMRGQPFPGPDILKRAVKQQIPLAAGSDSHRPQDVGRCFDRLTDLKI